MIRKRSYMQRALVHLGHSGKLSIHPVPTSCLDYKPVLQMRPCANCTCKLSLHMRKTTKYMTGLPVSNYMVETQYWRARSPQHQKNALLSTDCLSCPSERTLITWYWNSSICKLTHARSFLRHSLPPASTLNSEKSMMHKHGDLKCMGRKRIETLLCKNLLAGSQLALPWPSMGTLQWGKYKRPALIFL